MKIEKMWTNVGSQMLWELQWTVVKAEGGELQRADTLMTTGAGAANPVKLTTMGSFKKQK